MKRAPDRPRPLSIVVKRQGCPSLETQAQAEARNQKRIDDLVDRVPEVAVALEACCAEAHCGLLMCAICSEEEDRASYLDELRRIENMYRGPHEIANIHLATFPAGSLHAADMKKSQGALRARLQRSGLGGSILVGGTEAGWSEEQSRWILHVHLLAIGVPDEAWENLRAALRNSGPAIPLKVQPLRDVEYQLSYLLKFTTCHWPKARGPEGRGQGCPLPPDRLAELAAFWSRYRFDDFPFLFGARRRGGRIFPEH